MTHARRDRSNAEELALTTQVEGVCPLCGQSLFRRKHAREFKRYEIAHIYPLNPTEAEEKILFGLRKLATDPNHPDNLIALCVECHTAFDKYKSAEEYLELLEKKEALLELAEQRKLQFLYQLREEISLIVEALDSEEYSVPAVPLVLNAKSIDAKLDAEMPKQLKRKIRVNVNDFFTQVRERFQILDREKPGIAEQISIQVRAFYTAQKMQGWTQQRIYSGVTDWIAKRSRSKSREAAEIIAAFFVQNCEVFE